MTANRIFVHESIHDEFVTLFSKAMDAELKVGDGFTTGVTQGPIINQTQFNRVKNGILFFQRQELNLFS